MDFPALQAVCHGLAVGSPVIVDFTDGTSAPGEFQRTTAEHGGCLVVELQQGSMRWDAFFSAEDVARMSWQVDGRVLTL